MSSRQHDKACKRCELVHPCRHKHARPKHQTVSFATIHLQTRLVVSSISHTQALPALIPLPLPESASICISWHHQLPSPSRQPRRHPSPGAATPVPHNNILMPEISALCKHSCTHCLVGTAVIAGTNVISPAFWHAIARLFVSALHLTGNTLATYSC